MFLIWEVDTINNQNREASYHTQQIWIKPGHRMYDYFKELSQCAKNMHNVVNFYIRQVFTAWRNEGPLHPLQEEVLNTIYHNLDAMNEQQILAYQRRLAKENAKPWMNEKTIV